MTPSDRSKLARVAAYSLTQGVSESKIESNLHSIVSGATQGEIDRAMREGREALTMAQVMESGDVEGAAMAMMGDVGLGVTHYDILVRYRVGPDDETDWRSLTLTVSATSPLGDILGEIEAGARAQSREKGYNRIAPAYEAPAPTIVFAVGRYSEG